MRLFVAVEVPPIELPIVPPRAPERHLTLHFLGERPPEELPALRSAIARGVAGSGPIRLEFFGGGLFPGRSRPRVAWVGIGSGREELVRLRARVGRELAEAGLPTEAREFVPHLTLFRVRDAREAELARRVADALVGWRAGTASIDEIVLFESHLLPHGAEHRPVARFRLEGASPGAAPAPSA